MCGIFGGVSNHFLTTYEIGYIKQLGVLSQLRGIDGTGLITAKKKKNKKVDYSWAKKVQPAGSYLESKEARELMYASNTFCIVGHTRKATCGAITEPNAHPIQEGKIVGVHNGSIEHFAPPKQLEHIRTDSRTLIEKINQYGMEKAVDEVADGAYAVVYLDMTERTLNFARNYKRPLHFMWNKNKDTLYWASEREALDFLRMRESPTDFLFPFEISTNTLFTMRLGSLELQESDLPFPHSRYIMGMTPYQFETEPRPQLNIRPVLGLPSPKKESENSGKSISTGMPDDEKRKIICGRCHHPLRLCHCDYRRTVSRAKEQIRKQSSVPLINGTGDKRYLGWNREFLRIEDVQEILRAGCSTCSVAQLATATVFWISPNKYVCNHCYSDRTIGLYITESADKTFAGKLATGSFVSESRVLN